MKLESYPKYKESEVQWIGKVPREWDVRKLRYASKNKRNSFVDGPFGSDLKNEEYVDSGIPLIQLNNIGIGYHDLTNLRYITEEKFIQLLRHSIFPGDIVIAKMAEPVARATKVSDKFKKYIIVADCVKLSINNTFDSRYLIYSLNSFIREEAEIKSTGTTRLRINLEEIKSLNILVPPKSEQTQIAEYLDYKISEISKIIQTDNRLIELLKEKRTVLINQVVTKGLNPEAKMKDSGIEWIGEIPEVWNIIPFKMAIYTIVPMRDKPTSFDGDIPWIRIEDFDGKYISDSKSEQNVSKELVRNMNLKIYPAGTVLCSCSCNMGKVAIVKKPLTSNQTFIGMVPKKNILSDYIYYLIQIASEYLNGMAIGAIQTYLSQDEVKAIKICLPPKSEQIKIVKYLDYQTSKIDKTIEKIERKIELLEEYKKSLIHHVVTGKIDVRRT